MSIEDVPKEAFTQGPLDKQVHDRLLADLDQIVAKAGVPKHAVWSRLSQFCTPEEFNWVRTMRLPNDSGLIFIGSDFEVMVEDKMRAIVGACLRNYVDARMMSVQQVLSYLKDDAMPSCTVLLIPNFCLGKTDGGDLPSWDVHHLMGLLIYRDGRGLKTILSAPSMSLVEKQYGLSFKKHLESKFTIAKSSGLTSPEE